MASKKPAAKGGGKASAKVAEVAAPAPAPPPVEVAPDERKLRIRAAFNIFDPEATGTVGDEDVPTIFRYLNVFVPDKEYAEKVLPDLQGDEPTAFVRYDRFEHICISLMDKHTYEPDPEDILLSAFKALDPEGRGWIDAERMKELLCGIGSPGFKDKEFEAFAKVAADRTDPSRIYYEDYCALMSR